MIVVRPSNRCLQKTANCKTATKRLKKTEPTISCEPCVFEQKLKFPGSLGHCAQTYLKRSFVQSTKCSFLCANHQGFTRKMD
jgi:hypothetical protein